MCSSVIMCQCALSVHCTITIWLVQLYTCIYFYAFSFPIIPFFYFLYLLCLCDTLGFFLFLCLVYLSLVFRIICAFTHTLLCFQIVLKFLPKTFVWPFWGKLWLGKSLYLSRSLWLTSLSCEWIWKILTLDSLINFGKKYLNFCENIFVQPSSNFKSFVNFCENIFINTILIILWMHVEFYYIKCEIKLRKQPQLNIKKYKI